MFCFWDTDLVTLRSKMVMLPERRSCANRWNSGRTRGFNTRGAFDLDDASIDAPLLRRVISLPVP